MAAEQRGPQRVAGRLIVRDASTRFQVDESKIPPNMTYQWCVETVMGQEATEQIINREANGWEPVPPDRHPELVGRRGAKMPYILRGGMVLCQRAKEITDEVKEMDDHRARYAVASQMERLRLTGHRAGGKGISTRYIADTPEGEQA